MAELATLVDAARASELFTAPRLEVDLARFLDEQGDRLRQLAERLVAGEFDHVYFVGAGGSWANMYSGKYLLDRQTTVTSDVLRTRGLRPIVQARRPSAAGLCAALERHFRGAR